MLRGNALTNKSMNSNLVVEEEPTKSSLAAASQMTENKSSMTSKRFVLVQGNKELLFSNLDELSRHMSRQKALQLSQKKTKRVRHKSIKPTRGNDSEVLPSWRMDNSPHKQKDIDAIIKSGKQNTEGLSVRH